MTVRDQNSSANAASGNSGDGDRFVLTDAILKAVAGHEDEVLKAVGIDWPGGRGHIDCPYPDHGGANDWRWDNKEKKAFCTCAGKRGEAGFHSIFDVVMFKEDTDFEAAKIRVAELIGRADLIQVPRQYQAMDAASLLSAPVENRDDHLPVAYLAFRLGVGADAVPKPSTRMVGIRELGYFDAPTGKGDKPKQVGKFPCAVFETVDVRGRRHAHRIYLAQGGAGKADLGKRADGEERDPKKSARKIDGGDKVTGCGVVWGDPAQALHLIVAEGIETAAAVAFAWWAEIQAGAVAVVSAIDANGIEAFQPWPATRIITVAADRDEGTSVDGRPGNRRGELAARKLAMARQDRVEVRIALPGEPGTKTDWLDVLRAEGAEGVRRGVAGAEPFVHAEAGKDRDRGEAGNGDEDVKPRQTSAEPPLPLADFLSSDHWRRRSLDLPEPLLGELIVNTTRMFLGGQTGLGKTHLIMAMAGGMAAGTGFLHWTSSRPARVLMVDGEMPRDLVQERLNDLYARMGVDKLPNLFVFCREDAEELAELYPGLGEMQPLNSEAGRKWLLRLVDMLGGVDAVILDNRMSLLAGDMKDEVPWTDTMPLVKELTQRRIAQIWIDHTGHDASHIYGTKTKEWQFDTVALMEKAERPGAEIAFTLSFSKARRRKPSNRSNFDTVTVTLAKDEWGADGAAAGTFRRKVSHMAEAFHGALVNALVITPAPGTASRDLWYAECVRLGLADPIDPDDSRATKDRKKAKLRKYMAELKAANWIGVNGDTVRSLAVEPERRTGVEPRANPVEPVEPVPNPAQGVEPVSNPVEPVEPAEPVEPVGASDEGAEPGPAPAEPVSNLSNPVEPPADPGVSDPALGVEPVEPPKRGVEPVSNFSVSNLSNPVEPLSNPCRTPVEPSGGTSVEPSNPVSIDRFDSSTVRHPGSPAVEEAEKPKPNGWPEAAGEPTAQDPAEPPVPADIEVEFREIDP